MRHSLQSSSSAVLAGGRRRARYTMFFDLNVPVLRSSVERERSALLSQLFDYGYDCIALNTLIYGRLPKQHRCSTQRIHFQPPSLARRRSIREPSLLRTRVGVRRGLGGGFPLGLGATAEAGPDQVTRLTVVLSSVADAQVLTAGSDALQTYDIVAAVPCCQRSFEMLCRDSDVDIISLPSGKRVPFTINKKHTDAALARGAVFEITYSQAIQSSSARKYLIGNMQALVAFTRGRGIIISSGAENSIHTRSPHDVANLGQLLGLTQEQTLRAVSDTPLAVLRRSEARKSRFKGLTVHEDGGANALLLESLQIPKEFYLPEAVPSTDAVKGRGEEIAREGEAEKDKQKDEEDGDDDGGFLSFGATGMDVDTT